MLTKRLRTMVFLTVCLQAPFALTSGRAQEPTRMNAKQYVFFLDQLDSKIPLLKSHFSQLCQTPVWRRESPEVRNAFNSVYDGCRQLSAQMLGFLAEAVVGERLHSKLSVEFKMQFTLFQLMDKAESLNANRPDYDSRGDDTAFILNQLGPLANTLYSHVYASIDDKCQGDVIR